MVTSNNKTLIGLIELIPLFLLTPSSDAFVLRHNESQLRVTKLQLNIHPTGKSFCLNFVQAVIFFFHLSSSHTITRFPVSKQISFSKKGTTSKHESTYNQDNDEFDEDIFHRRIVHFEKVNGGEEKDAGKKSSKKFGGWNHRQFAKSIDP